MATMKATLRGKLVDMERPARVVVRRTGPLGIASDHRWYVQDAASEAILFSPDMVGEDATLKACETWLGGQGYKANGPMPPDCFEYTHGG